MAGETGGELLLEDSPFTLGQKLYQLQQSQYMCDSVIVTSVACIPVHKIVLVSRCQYFENLLQSSSFDSSQSKKMQHYRFLLETEPHENVLTLICFLYTGEMYVTYDNVQSLRELSKRLGIKEVVSLCDKFISNLKTKFPKDSMNITPESEECEDINTAICPKGLQFEESESMNTIEHVEGLSSSSKQSFQEVYLHMMKEEESFRTCDNIQMSEQGEGIPIFTDMIVEQNSIHENDKDIPVEYCVSIKYEDDTDSYDISESVDDYSTETMFLRQDGANQDNQVSLPNEKTDEKSTHGDKNKLATLRPRVKKSRESKQNYYRNNKTSKYQMRKKVGRQKQQIKVKIQSVKSRSLLDEHTERKTIKHLSKSVDGGKTNKKENTAQNRKENTAQNRKENTPQNIETKNDQVLENVKELKPLCDKCGNTYDTVQKLKKHIKIHKDDKYTCPECGKDLSTPYTLKAHIFSVHSNDPNKYQHLCHLCPRKFIENRNLQNHLLRHHGLMPSDKTKVYKCDHCDYASCYKDKFSVHQRAHTIRENTYACGVCGKCFPEKLYRNRHQIRHTKERTLCPVKGCKFSAVEKINVKNHVFNMHTNKEFKGYHCHLCPYSCKLNGNLTKHLSNKHKVDVLTLHKKRKIALQTGTGYPMNQHTYF